MGNFVYCNGCKIPVKAFDQGPVLNCGHPDDYANYKMYSSGGDHDEDLDSWNINHPDKPVTVDMAYKARAIPCSHLTVVQKIKNIYRNLTSNLT